MRLANWYFLFLIPIIIYLFFIRKNKMTIKFSSIKLLRASGLKKTIKHKIGKYIIIFALIILTIALARPQIDQKNLPFEEKGIDIGIVIDVSGSMEAIDFKPNRLTVAIETIKNFIDQRPQDRISLIIFGGTAYTRIPLTLDHDIVKESMAGITTKSVNEGGTAIGMAISVGVNRLKKSESASKIILLITDGDNNAGSINPKTASELAKDLGIKIYTIGVGSDETIIPVQYMGQTVYQQIQGGLNEELLQEIANVTSGGYFRAKDPQTLNNIFATINKLEKTDFKQEDFKQYKELAYFLIKLALLLLVAGVLLDRYYFIQLP